MLLLLLACEDPANVDAVDTGHLDLPGHSECLPEGEEMSLEVCEAVVIADERMPTVPQRAAYTDEDWNDPRLDDPEYLWLESEIKRCTCSCCHTQAAGGPGSHRWAIDYEPVWIDSMNDWSMSVFTGQTDEPEQTLPTSDFERFLAVIEREREAREARRDP